MLVASIGDYSGGAVVVLIENMVTGILREIVVDLHRTGVVGDASWQPSVRTLQSFGLTRMEWNNNVLQYCSWEGKLVPVQTKYILGNVFEDQLSYETADDLVATLNSSWLGE